jgi:hypothetical protein
VLYQKVNFLNLFGRKYHGICWQLAVAKAKGKRWFSLNTHVGFLEDVYKRDLNTFWKNIL